MRKEWDADYPSKKKKKETIHNWFFDRTRDPRERIDSQWIERDIVSRTTVSGYPFFLRLIIRIRLNHHQVNDERQE